MAEPLQTIRLLLRMPTLDDAPRVQQLADDYEVAKMLALLPYPYTLQDAYSFISMVREDWESGDTYTFAIMHKAEDALIGVIGLGNNRRHLRGEMGYWIGQPYWGQGYASEAARRVIQFGFETLGLERISATHFAHNPASGRVMQKAGMRYEGLLRGHFIKWGQPVDMAQYAILRGDYEAI
jgi:RimJ/RimL family protein N-acetyltransferase